jgi:hypothetical protein
MALVLTEPFNNFTAAPWVLGGTPTIVTGRTGTGASIGPSALATYALSVPTEYLTVGFAWRISSAAAGLRFIFELLSNAGATLQCRLMHNSNGALDFQRGSLTIGSSATGLIVTNTYYYIEVQVRLHDTLGSVVVRRNGTPVLTLTNVDTRVTGTAMFDRLRLGTQTSGATAIYDDLYLRDDAVFQGDPTVIGVNYWDGSTFLKGPARTWNGSAYVAALAVKTWNGTAFV